LEFKPGQLLAAQPLPPASEYDNAEATKFEQMKQAILVIRSWSTAMQSKTVTFRNSGVLNGNESLVKRLAMLRVFEEQQGEIKGLKLPVEGMDVYISADKEKGRAHLEKMEQLYQTTERIISNFEARLSNNDYIQNAPDEIVEETKHQLEWQKSKLPIFSEEIRIVKDWLNR